MQGWRLNMEDAHVSNAKFQDSNDKALFGVFDGHGGREVAIYCNLNYEKILKNSANTIKDVGEQEWLRRSFLAVDDDLKTAKG
jgi:serine/threonine protein phosphatase PrpC